MRADKVMETAKRADLVRQRRAQRSQQNVSRTRQAAARSIPSQPVIVRGSHPAAARPLRNSTQSRVRRQYYYTLGTSGAELRLPAIPFLKLDWRLLSGLLVILMGLAIYTLLSAPQFKVQEIDVQGIQRLTPGDIDAALAVRGQSIVNFNLPEAREKLAAAFPELTDIKITVGLPARIVVQVIERVPVVSWNSTDGSYWIDSQGYILPPRGEAADLMQIAGSGSLPLLPLPETTVVNDKADSAKAAEEAPGETPAVIWGRQIDSTIVKTLLDLRSRIPAESSLVYDIVNGLGWKDTRGWNVFIGKDLTNFDLKLSMYQEIIGQLEQQGKLPSQMVSVEFINSPFYK